MSKVIDKIARKFIKLRLRPIRVFVFHQVSDTFDPDSMWECDWTETEQFKRNIIKLKSEYDFISLQNAYLHIKNDIFRRRKYAVLTSDDGWDSIMNVIPWLANQQIPLTLFLNPQYLDGVHYQGRSTEKLLTTHDVEHLIEEFHPYITIASHGWTHNDCRKMDMSEFIKSVLSSEEYLSSISVKVPFYAYSYGQHSEEQNAFIRRIGLTPVLADGMVNYNDVLQIHRECIDGHSFCVYP